MELKMDADISQSLAEFLIKLRKIPVATNDYKFPNQQCCKLSIPLKSEDGRYNFMLDINRNKINLSKITYQNRTRTNIILVRLDLNGAPHRNPDGGEISGNHIHIYKEGFSDKIAEELPKEFKNIEYNNVKQFFKTFLQYCNISGIPEMTYKEFMDNIV